MSQLASPESSLPAELQAPIPPFASARRQRDATLLSRRRCVWRLVWRTLSGSAVLLLPPTPAQTVVASARPTPPLRWSMEPKGWPTGLICRRTPLATAPRRVPQAIAARTSAVLRASGMARQVIALTRLLLQVPQTNAWSMYPKPRRTALPSFSRCAATRRHRSLCHAVGQV